MHEARSDRWHFAGPRAALCLLCALAIASASCSDDEGTGTTDAPVTDRDGGGGGKETGTRDGGGSKSDGSTDATAARDMLTDGPVLKRWVTLSGPAPAVSDHTATLLDDGKVLIAGGIEGSSATSRTAKAWLYDPKTKKFTQTAAMSTAREWHAAFKLADGRVMVAGGHTGVSSSTATTEIYNPKTGKWSAGPALPQPRGEAAAVRLSTTRFVLIGGADGSTDLDTIISYDAKTNKWSTVLAKLSGAYALMGATKLSNGKVLIAGGLHSISLGQATLTRAIQIYDPAKGTIKTLSDSLSYGRYGPTAHRLPDGRVIIIGGSCGNACTKITSNALYDPVSDKVSSISHQGTPPVYHGVASLIGGDLLICGGIVPKKFSAMAKCVLLDTSGGLSWSNAPSMSVSRMRHTLTTLRDGTVLAVGGAEGPAKAPATTAELLVP